MGKKKKKEPSNIDQALIALETIYEYEEDEDVVELNSNYDVKLDEEVEELSNYFMVKVIAPNEEKWKSLAKKIAQETNFLYSVHYSLEKFETSQDEKNIMFKVGVEYDIVENNIINDMESNCVDNCDLDEKDWEKIRESNEWKSAKTHYARALVASEILRKIGVR